MVNKFEQLASWYLRLNGYFTVPNFIFHSDTPRSQRTEADILGVRFPYSREVTGEEMKRDESLVRQDEKIDFIIAEVKRGACRLNGPWTDPRLENMHYVLRWLGMVSEAEVHNVAEDLYTSKVCEREKWGLRLVCFGKRKSPRLHRNVLQFTHEEVVLFMSDRFREHANVKACHQQWDSFIKEFYTMAVRNRMDAKQILERLSDQANRSL